MLEVSSEYAAAVAAAAASAVAAVIAIRHARILAQGCCCCCLCCCLLFQWRLGSKCPQSWLRHSWQTWALSTSARSPAKEHARQSQNTIGMLMLRKALDQCPWTPRSAMQECGVQGPWQALGPNAARSPKPFIAFSVGSTGQQT
jgi:hypothetical protein